MTERERVSATYSKVQKLQPNLESVERKKQLAVQLEQRRNLWISIAFLCGAMLCTAVWCLLSDEEINDTLRGFCVVFYIVSTFEFFRTVFNASKIYAHYGACAKAKYQGVLTRDAIRKEIQKAGRSQEQSFQIVRARLYDKDDRDDSAISFIFHKYNLYFLMDDNTSAVSFRVKRRIYLTAPLDEMYILVLSQSGTVFAAYNASAWEIGTELFELCKFDVASHNSSIDKNIATNTDTASKDNWVVWKILLLVSYVLSLFLPVIILLLYLPVAVILAAKMAIKKKNALSVACTAIGYFLLTYLLLFLCLQ